MPVRDLTPEEMVEWEAQKAKREAAMQAWEAKRKVQMVEEAKLQAVIDKGTEAELAAAIEVAKNVQLELGPPINIRRAELRLMDLRGEERPDVWQYLRKADEKIAEMVADPNSGFKDLAGRAHHKWVHGGDKPPDNVRLIDLPCPY